MTDAQTGTAAAGGSEAASFRRWFRERGTEKRWFFAATRPGSEETVRDLIALRAKVAGLDDEIASAHVPLRNVRNVRDGDETVTAERMFPGYVLIGMTPKAGSGGRMSRQALDLILNTPKVTDFVRADEAPSPVGEEELRRTFSEAAKMNEAPAQEPRKQFAQGAEVLIGEGSFKGLIGTVTEVDREKETVTAEVSVFGQTASVEVAFSDAAAVPPDVPEPEERRAAGELREVEPPENPDRSGTCAAAGTGQERGPGPGR